MKTDFAATTPVLDFAFIPKRFRVLQNRLKLSLPIFCSNRIDDLRVSGPQAYLVFVCCFDFLVLQYVFAREAIKIIKHHDANTPLYLYLPFQAVHGPLQVLGWCVKCIKKYVRASKLRCQSNISTPFNWKSNPNHQELIFPIVSTELACAFFGNQEKTACGPKWIAAGCKNESFANLNQQRWNTFEHRPFS